MVFSMYRQKAMPRVSCRTHAHLEEDACSVAQSSTLPHPTPGRQQGPATKLHAPATLPTRGLRPQKRAPQRQANNKDHSMASGRGGAGLHVG